MAALIFARAGLVRVVRPVSDFYAAGRLVPSFLNALALASSSVAALVFAGAYGAIDFDWAGVTVLGAGFGLGLWLAGLLLAPYLRAYGGFTLPDFLAERFGGESLRPLAVVAILLCSFPALAVVLLAFGLLADAVFTLPLGAGAGAGAALIFVATLIGGMRSLSLSQIAYYGILFIVGLAAILVLLWQAGTLIGVDTVLIDEVVPSFGGDVFLGGAAFTQDSPVNSFALLFCLATGFAALPYLLMRSFAAPSASEARTAFLAAPVLLLLLGVSAPALAALYEAAQLASGDALSMIGEALLVVGAVAALLATGAALALSIGNVLSYDVFYKSLQPDAPVSRQVFVARVCVIAVTGLAALAALAAPEASVTATTAAFSIAGSAFLPVLVLGVWWKRLGADAALAGMVAGLVACLYYMIGPHTIPFIFYESSSFLSNATDLQISDYERLRHDYYLAAGDAAAQASILSEWRQTVQPMANWLGVHGALAGVFAVPIGFLVMAIVGAFTQKSPADIQRFVRELRAKTA